MQVRLAHSGGAPAAASCSGSAPTSYLDFEFICIITVKVSFFSLAVELPIPSLKQSIIKFTFKISAHCDFWACQSCTDQTNFSALLGIFSSGVRNFYECVSSAAAAPRVSWSSSIDCLDNPENMLLQLASLSSLPGMKAQGNFRCTYLMF